MRLKGSSVTVLGDVSVETSGSLRDITFNDLNRDVLTYSPLRVETGGSAWNFALAACEAFERVNLMAKVGNDLPGELVLQAVASSSVHSLIEMTENAPTGCALYLRDGSKAVQRGHRLLVVDRGANRCIDVAYIERHAPEIRASSVLFLDGYCFLERTAREASELAMEIARKGGASVAFDLVPHDAQSHFSSEDIMRWIATSDLLIAEVRTIRRVIGLEADEEVLDREVALETLARLRPRFPRTSFHLRFGPGNIEYSLVAETPDEAVIRTNNYLAASQTRGFGDRLSAVDVAAWIAKKQSSKE